MAQENAPKLPVYVALGTDTAKMAEIVRRLKLYVQPQMSFLIVTNGMRLILKTVKLC